MHERVIPPDPSIAVIDDARIAVSFAVEHADDAAFTIFEAQINRRFQEANALTESVTSAILSVRRALPTTRVFDPALVADARHYIAAAEAHLAERGEEPAWVCYPQAECIGLGADLLRIASLLLTQCEAEQTDEADVTYERVFELYERWRNSTVELARAAEADPVGTWNAQVDDDDDQH
ncbi:MAG: hypothetical protein ACJAYU_000554 [Bradymonadia bacterium]|jgi:hypothetical protein